MNRTDAHTLPQADSGYPWRAERSSGGGSQSARRSNTSNYLLGAVFGAAVFLGTVFTGLSADEEAPVAPSSDAVTVASTAY
ncbi:hypothetical protein [Corynebacterium sp.]|uniref:hypothetical protein n=1 Tax=Corynebacterium sp. TaxID=1720 RepID=UPI0026DAC269|nr:hypothetical protein [Corynebacterium sp.]MDO5031694.1 hypothetical protein [Corynebacterium sp.]